MTRELMVLIGGMVSFLACVGEDAAVFAPPQGSSSGSGDASAEDASSGPCTAQQDSCGGGDASTLSKCRADGSGFDTTPCALGCVATPDAHCRDFYPAEPLSRNDLVAGNGGTTSITFPAGTTILNSDTGEISVGLTRSANEKPAVLEVNAGTAFHLVSGVGVFAFGDVTISPGAKVKIVGTAAVALASSGDVIIGGDIDVRPMLVTGDLCKANSAGPGADRGGAGTTDPGGFGGNGLGMGGGHGGFRSTSGAQAGGGGGGHMGKGGKGDLSCKAGNADAAATSPGPSYLELRGGSGGGGGGGGAGQGGGGGGFIRIVAAHKITIGKGATTEVHGINAGGCGGSGSPGGGGGGSGGAIWLAAPVVELVEKGAIAANGGGGGGNPKLCSTCGQGPRNGEDGALSAAAAIGAGNTTTLPWGGNGGAGDTLAGQDANTGTCTDNDSWGYGGGGAAGRIQIDTMIAPTLSETAIVSPSKSAGGAFFGNIDLH